MTVLVTGGAGYIGSQLAHELVDAGEPIVLLDDLSTGFRWATPEGARLVVGDCGDRGLVARLIEAFSVKTIIHLAGSVSVPDSLRDPIRYYRNNTLKSLDLIAEAIKGGVRQFIFSSTAAVYGEGAAVPVSEDAACRPASPYGQSKLFVEAMLADIARTHDFRYVILRYFNVAGADPKLRTGSSDSSASHLVKAAVEAASGTRPYLLIYGTNYPTADGSCVRDYIHVGDVARAHLSAIRHLSSGGDSTTLNCGYGRGYSVLDIIASVKRVCGHDFPVHIADPRPGDIAEMVADVTRIKSMFEWAPRFDDIDTIVTHALAWEGKLQQRAARVSGG